MDTPDTPARADIHDKDTAATALNLFRGDLTDDTLAAHLKALRGDPHWRVFVLEGPKVRDVELIYTPTKDWYTFRLTKVRRLRGAVWRRTS
jgi:hypothetical protein